MTPSTTIDLLNPFEHHNRMIETITLKEPSAHLYAELGEPRLGVSTENGGYWVEQPTTIRQYMDKLITHQDGAELLKLMSIADFKQLKETLFGFFVAAEAAIILKRQTSFASAPTNA